MKITVLGSASSFGTPAAGGFWGKCDPKEPRNERTRAAILVQSDTTDILVDATYDLRTQLNRVPQNNIDAVLLTHSHSDHINGIDDMRAISFHRNELLPVYSNKETLDEVERRWPYVFKAEFDIYKEFLTRNEIAPYNRFRVGDIDIDTFEQDHTVMKTVGYRFGNFAYSVDMANLDARAIDALRGVEVWLVDGGSYHRETVSTHANFKRIFEWVEILKPKMTYITVLTTHMDYKTMCDELPPHIRPAYDGLVIDMNGNC